MSHFFIPSGFKPSAEFSLRPGKGKRPPDVPLLRFYGFPANAPMVGVYRAVNPDDVGHYVAKWRKRDTADNPNATPTE